MSSTGGKKRILCLDYSKGIAILLLLLSHCMSGTSILKTWIFSFHMPIFFIICGILAAGNYPDGIRVNRFGSYLKKRCIQLLLPYFIWGGRSDRFLSISEYYFRSETYGMEPAYKFDFSSGD